MTRRLLIAYAHPDDESFGLGGLISRYVAEGVEVDLICATNGERGTVNPEFLNGYDSIKALRLAELDCAAEQLGLTHVVKLGYKDSGMMGSETAQDPECLWQAPQGEVTRRVVEVIRDLQPQVVLTFNRYGGYGHPDHIAIQRATTDAFKLAGDPAYVTDQAPYQPQKLYYSSISTRQIQLGILLTRLRRQDPRHLGRNHDMDLVAILDHVEPTHTLIDIRDWHEAWDTASACHASQIGGGAFRIPLQLRRLLSANQGFTRIVPAPARDRVDEFDLFDGVKLDRAGRHMTDPDAAAAARIDRLLDAIDLVKEDRRGEARHLLRDLIREDNDFEDAWLWMSVAVDSLDQSSICLDNVLRVNPKNNEAAGALYRIRIPELQMQKQRTRLRLYRDAALTSMWLIITALLVAVFMTIVSYGM